VPKKLKRRDTRMISGLGKGYQRAKAYFRDLASDERRHKKIVKERWARGEDPEKCEDKKKGSPGPKNRVTVKRREGANFSGDYVK